VAVEDKDEDEEEEEDELKDEEEEVDDEVLSSILLLKLARIFPRVSQTCCMVGRLSGSVCKQDSKRDKSSEGR
jgi:hypothetical protein